MSFLVFSENRELAYQLLGKARELADTLGVTVSALVTEGEAEAYIHQGADRVFTADFEYGVESLRDALLKAVETAAPKLVLIGSSKLGKEVAPRVAAALRVGCMTECTDLTLVDGELVFERLTYGGSTIAKETSLSATTIATFPPRTFEKLEPAERAGEVTALSMAPSTPRVKVVERREKPRSDVDLENARIIVSAGRGFKDKDDLRLLTELAEVLGAGMGCTRPISADLGWMDEWVGISGHKVKPMLYVACGVSGTIQHVAGIRDSQIIVSINNDENAGIHGLSDYSIVGDLYEVLPALVRALRESG